MKTTWFALRVLALAALAAVAVVLPQVGGRSGARRPAAAARARCGSRPSR